LNDSTKSFQSQTRRQQNTRSNYVCDSGHSQGFAAVLSSHPPDATMKHLLVMSADLVDHELACGWRLTLHEALARVVLGALP
jgi:hypothetical protein